MVIGITIPCFLVLSTIVCCIGLVMLAYFYVVCDPLDVGDYEADQLVILFAVRTLRKADTNCRLIVLQYTTSG